VDVCAGVTPAGGIQGSGEVCTTDATVVPVLVNGSFGSSPTLTISGPNGFTFTATLTPSSSDPCSFEYDWSFADTAGAGDYTYTVTGNGHTFTFGAPLICTPPPPPPPPPPDDVCPGATPGGQVMGTGNICGTRIPSIPMTVQGNFGDSPTITITAPDGSTATATLQSDDSCNYRYVWQADVFTGDGDYTFTVTGNGLSVSFSSYVFCNPRQNV
jgi:hypothetical protein